MKTIFGRIRTFLAFAAAAGVLVFMVRQNCRSKKAAQQRDRRLILIPAQPTDVTDIVTLYSAVVKELHLKAPGGPWGEPPTVEQVQYWISKNIAFVMRE